MDDGHHVLVLTWESSPSRKDASLLRVTVELHQDSSIVRRSVVMLGRMGVVNARFMLRQT